MPRTVLRRSLPLAASLLFAALLACAAPSATLRRVVARPLQSEQVLRPGQGFVVLHLELSHDVPRLDVVPTDDAGRRFHLEDLPEGITLWLIAVDAGEYRFDGVEIMGYQRRGKLVPYEADLNEENPFLGFTVHEGEVNYPGRLVITRRGLRLSSFTMNRSGEVAQILRDEADWLLLRHRTSYTGRRRDNFLDYYSTRLQNRRIEEIRKIEAPEEPGTVGVDVANP